MILLRVALLFVAIGIAQALFEKSDVVDLTSANFDSKVIKGHEFWMVKFYSPGCIHCQRMAKEYKKAAKALKGIAKFGAVDATVHRDIAAKFGVNGYPTLKIFGEDKTKPVDYNGDRTTKSFIEGLSKELTATLRKLSGEEKTNKKGDSKKGKNKKGDGKKGDKNGDVVVLTGDNFKKLVLNSKEPWMVEFFAPWCGHCKNLEPNWKAASKEMAGKVKFGAVDATVHENLAQEYGIRGFPTIKYFAPGSSARDAQNYEGGRSTGDLVQFADQKFSENAPAPEVVEAISGNLVRETCEQKQLCVLAFLPHILDCQSECRKRHIATLQSVSEAFRSSPWGWAWMEAGSQMGIEEAFEVGGFGYPALAAFSPRKMKFSIFKGSFSKDGVKEFLRDTSFGKSRIEPIQPSKLADDGFLKISTIPAWDGKDGVAPKEDDIDISDVDLDNSNEL